MSKPITTCSMGCLEQRLRGCRPMSTYVRLQLRKDENRDEATTSSDESLFDTMEEQSGMITGTFAMAGLLLWVALHLSTAFSTLSLDWWICCGWRPPATVRTATSMEFGWSQFLPCSSLPPLSSFEASWQCGEL